MIKLKCPTCNVNFKLLVEFSGCDWDTKKGEGSNYNYPISLNCSKCGAVYTLGHLKNECDFSVMKDELKVVD